MESVPLQLGTAGSKSVINFGTYTSLEVAQVKDVRHYFDIVNLDRYDAIIGTRAMQSLGVTLDFKNDRILIGDKVLLPLSEGEERAVIVRRYSMRQSSKSMIAHQD